MKLRMLHRGHVKALLGAKRAAGLSKNTVRLIRATLSVMLGDALEDGVVTANPVLGIGRRGRKRADAISQAERVKKIRPMSYEQLATFLVVAGAHASRRDATLFLTLAEAGLRPGEALALQWPDIDLAGRTVRVERAVSCGEVKATKTEETRTVDLSTRLAEALSDLQARAEAEALLASQEVSPWVFPSAAGTPLDAQARREALPSTARAGRTPALPAV